MNQIILHILNNIQAYLGINEWHRWFYAEPPLHPSCLLLLVVGFTCTDRDYLDGYLFSFINEDLDEDTDKDSLEDTEV